MERREEEEERIEKIRDRNENLRREERIQGKSTRGNWGGEGSK